MGCTRLRPSHPDEKQLSLSVLTLIAISGRPAKDLDIKVRCRFCLKHEAVKRWRCACGVIWHTCAIHSCHYCGDDTTLKRKLPIDPDTDTGQEKHARNATGMAEPDYNALLASDTRRAKESKQRDKRKAGAIALGSSSSMPKKPTVLGPILSARFPGITSSSSRYPACIDSLP